MAVAIPPPAQSSAQTADLAFDEASSDPDDDDSASDDDDVSTAADSSTGNAGVDNEVTADAADDVAQAGVPPAPPTPVQPRRPGLRPARTVTFGHRFDLGGKGKKRGAYRPSDKRKRRRIEKVINSSIRIVDGAVILR